ncbi:lipopolysaccharide biosynthesis protein [Hymenobacter properus]|uniref:Lipopolysaccharide biosynthesis protein n=1 Tax=Hymenobacter properus TaxID=2791026 RepID=A0A931FMT9_9BACT|nr:lipopolysaccharide biosynthesis protein [Hymenobacter properus]MBF9143431.1 lipopolysaccharide biosynthesis protein [Hymenobacter properus]MBR7722244.1 lipopolysaccharide biosynthesis protein [Microvirga sp. SRT04]
MIKRLTSVVKNNLSALQQKGSFTRNLAITLSGSTLSTLIGILLTPVVSRIYSPIAYGQFAVYNALVSNLNLLTTLSYPGAFLLPRRRLHFLALVQLTLLVTLSSCIMLTIGLGFAGPWIVKQLHVEGLGNWFYTLPLMLLMFNINGGLSLWYMRDKQFGKRVGVEIATNMATKGFTVGYGLLIQGNVVGLLLADFFNRLSATIMLALGSIRQEFKSVLRTFSWRRLWLIAYRYRKFPLIYMPGGYVYVASTQLPVFLLAPVFGAASVGLYSFSMSLLEMPVNVLGAAIVPVYMQKATETYRETPERLPSITLSLYYKLLYIGVVPFSIVTVYGDVLFRVVFGAKWEMAGVFTGYLGFYSLFKLLSLGTSGIYNIMERQKYYLYANMLLLAIRAVGLGIGVSTHNLDLTLLLFGAGSLLATFAVDLHVLYLLKLPVVRIALRTLFLIGATVLLVKLSRWGFTPLFPKFLAVTPRP